MSGSRMALWGTMVFVGLASLCRAEDEVNVAIAQVKDTRSTEAFQSELTLDLKFFGADVDKVVAFRFKAAAAVDNLGKNLIRPDRANDDFQQFGVCSVRLKNPTRKATTIREMTGTLELVIPDRDPNATVVVDNFVGRPRLAASHPSLAANKVEITMFSKDEYEKELNEAKKKETSKSGTEAAGAAMGAAMGQLFGGMFGGMGQVDENSVIAVIKDPDKNVVKAVVSDKSGVELEGRGTTRSSDVWTFFFAKKPPDSAVLRVYLSTPKSLVTVPFSIKDVVLP